uniref:Transcription and mRNA export factor ENY2 n=1 Tax=Falco tinnunculus TaxID=100819 RepID=A0A8C4URU1_FALTI
NILTLKVSIRLLTDSDSSSGSRVSTSFPWLQHQHCLKKYCELAPDLPTPCGSTRLKELLRAKLIECGWKDQLKAHCKDVIKEKGLEHVTVDDLVAEITPKGRALVPDSVKKELLQRIRTFLAQHASL